jgi:hypothetical protein
MTNCHPFRHDRWLFMHNGYINDFARIKRDLILAVDPSLYPEIQGQADTEVLFFLALTFGLEDAPRPPSSKRSGSSKRLPAAQGVPHPFQGTVATTDGESIWAFRYSSERNSRSLFYTTDVPHRAKAPSRAATVPGGVGERAAGRLRAPRRRRRRLERGARVDLRHRRPRPQRAAAIPTPSAIDLRTRGCLRHRLRAGPRSWRGATTRLASGAARPCPRRTKPMQLTTGALHEQ